MQHALRFLPSPESLDTEWKEVSHPHIENPVHPDAGAGLLL